MKTDTSVETAAAFVIKRIEEEAFRLQEPLDDEQQFLLTNLPTTSTSSTSSGGFEELPPVVTLRDFNYEKLCRITRSAIEQDFEASPYGTANWQLAAAVFKLNEHPMAWLLEWGGVNPERPWWDKWLLVVAGLIFVVFGMVAMFIVDSHPSPVTWMIAASGYVIVLVLLYRALKGLEKWQLGRTIEKLRDASLAV
jgi:hypothetical protein